MNLSERIDLVTELGGYLQSDAEEWQNIKKKAFKKNSWFTMEFINLASKNIAEQFLQKDKIQQWVNYYHLDDNIQPKDVGIVMAGNIPLVGFHDFLSVFISGHTQTIKLSSKDDILLKHLVERLSLLNHELGKYIQFADRLKGCYAYIATGSNNTARYFDYYFGKYQSIIRRNRTSVAILNGDEKEEELSLLADDVQQFFGLGCRNVTQIFVPEDYDFVPLLTSLKKYNYFIDHTKYRNNYDYNLALHIMNNHFYMTNESILLTNYDQPFSPISQLNYSYYKQKESLKNDLFHSENIQCIAGENVSFGQAQKPSLFSYADGRDTIEFLLSL